MEKLEFGVYRGEDFLQFEFEPKQFLIDGLIHRGDSVLLIGDPKAGKSLLVKQMVCALTSGAPFLGKFDVLEPSSTLYVQLEGEAPDTQDRLRKMMKKEPLAPENFSYFFAEPMRLEDDNGFKDFCSDVDILPIKPKTIIIDGLYLAFSGSLSDDDVIRRVIANFRRIKARYNCTLIIVHHTHKVRLSQDGKPIEEGDHAIFGSQFLRAFPDHIIHLKIQKNSDVRELLCSTQRSGQIEKSVKLKLIQPDPLHFETLDEVPTGIVYDNFKSKIMHYLDQAITGGANGAEIREAISVPKTTFYKVVSELITEGRIYKDGVSRNSYYRSLKKEPTCDL